MSLGTTVVLTAARVDVAQGPTVWWHPGVTGQSFLRGQGIPGGLPVDWQPVTHVYINECVCARLFLARKININQ